MLVLLCTGSFDMWVGGGGWGGLANNIDPDQMLQSDSPEGDI